MAADGKAPEDARAQGMTRSAKRARLRGPVIAGLLAAYLAVSLRQTDPLDYLVGSAQLLLLALVLAIDLLDGG